MRRKLTCEGHCALSEKERRKKEKNEREGKEKRESMWKMSMQR